MRLGSARLHELSNFALVLVLLGLPSVLVAQQPTPPSSGKQLTVERIYSQPSLNGRPTRGLTWTPDGKQVSYFETKGAGREAKTELWVMDAATGERKLLVAAEKLEALLPPNTSRPAQATHPTHPAPPHSQRPH